MVLKSAQDDSLDILAFQPDNYLMISSTTTKTSTLIITFHDPVGESNPYVHFVYCPETIFSHTQVKVSG